MNSSEFENFVITHEKDLYSFCCYLCGAERGLAADLYQDTVLAAFEMRERIDFSRSPKALLFSIAVGKWKNTWRKAKRRQSKMPETAVEEPKTAAEDNPEMIIQSNFVREAIQSALSRLNDKFRIPLILFYFEHHNLETIAEICNVPKGTIKSRLHKGRILLKTALEKEGI